MNYGKVFRDAIFIHIENERDHGLNVNNVLEIFQRNNMKLNFAKK